MQILCENALRKAATLHKVLLFAFRDEATKDVRAMIDKFGTVLARGPGIVI